MSNAFISKKRRMQKIFNLQFQQVRHVAVSFWNCISFKVVVIKLSAEQGELTCYETHQSAA